MLQRPLFRPIAGPLAALVASTLLLATASAAPPGLRSGPPASWALPSHSMADTPGIGDEFWSDRFGLPDPDGWIDCIVAMGGGFVVGGWFTHIGETPARNIAMWDGSRWLPLGAGIDGEVVAVAVYRGELIASGPFSRSGDSAVQGIARWSTGQWLPLGAGLSIQSVQATNGASALAVAGDVLYAAGDFDHAGDVPARHVAAWDGVNWAALGAGLDGPAQSLLASGDSLYAGGSFHSAGAVPASGVALWDGRGWSGFGEGVASSLGALFIFAIARGASGLVVTGYFDQAGTASVRNIATWDGAAWHAMGNTGGGLPNLGRSLVVRGDTVLVGSDRIYAWDGVRLVPYGPPVLGLVNALCETPAGLAVGGQFEGFDFQYELRAAGIGLWAAGGWSELQPWSSRTRGLAGFGQVEVRALASYRGDLIAAGIFDYAGSTFGREMLTGLARWDGDEWSGMGSSPGGFVNALLGEGDSLCAAGNFYGTTAPAWVFDGTTWAPLGTLSLDPASLARYSGSLFVAGGRKSLSDPRTGGVYRRTGDGWQALGMADSPDSFPRVSAMQPFGGRLVVGGSFTAIGGVPANGLAAWDGSAWMRMDAGVQNPDIDALCECGGTLYAGGFFPGPAGGRGVVKWDGAKWDLLVDTDVQVAPYAMGCADGHLYAGGIVLSRSSDGNRGIARWEDTGWSPLGSGANDAVRAVLVMDRRLYVGGRFSIAGGRSSSGIAEWDLEAEQAAHLVSVDTGIPNPFTISTRVAYRLESPGHVRAVVYDVRGRRIAVVLDAFQPAGSRFVSWDGRIDEGRAAPPGVYFVRVELPGHTEQHRVVRLR